MSPLIYKWKPFFCSGNHVKRFIVPLTTFRNVHLLVIQIPLKAYSMLSVVCFTSLIITQAKIKSFGNKLSNRSTVLFILKKNIKKKGER